MRAEQAKELGIKTISDLAAVSNQLTLGTGQEFRCLSSYAKAIWCRF